MRVLDITLQEKKVMDVGSSTRDAEWVTNQYENGSGWSTSWCWVVDEVEQHYEWNDIRVDSSNESDMIEYWLSIGWMVGPSVIQSPLIAPWQQMIDIRVIGLVTFIMDMVRSFLLVMDLGEWFDYRWSHLIDAMIFSKYNLSKLQWLKIFSTNTNLFS